MKKLGLDAQLPLELLYASRMIEWGEPADRIADRYEEIAHIYATRPTAEGSERRHYAEMLELVTGLVKQYRDRAEAGIRMTRREERPATTSGT